MLSVASTGPRAPGRQYRAESTGPTVPGGEHRADSTGRRAPGRQLALEQCGPHGSAGLRGEDERGGSRSVGYTHAVPVT
jgi:hypothetical protein